MRVAVLMGSRSDEKRMAPVAETLEQHGVASDVFVMSAHRHPKRVSEFAAAAHETYDIVICGAGMAAHLAGAVAAQTSLPVIGVPLSGGVGLDSLLSTVQMPPGVPVATVAVDGAVNAALLAVRILSVGEKGLQPRLGGNH